MKWKLNWKGDQVAEEVSTEVLAPAMGDIGLDVEGESKKDLYPGHGKVTATLQRSIHTAEPGYNWASDNVEPSPGAPERGGRVKEAMKKTGKLVVQVGSGLIYAIYVHQGHRSFGGYHFITNAVDKVRPRVRQHIERHKLR